MKIEEVKRNLNKIVSYKDRMDGTEADYILAACIIRRNEKGFYYQVEIRDMKANSVTICRMEDVQAKKENENA